MEREAASETCRGSRSPAASAGSDPGALPRTPSRGRGRSLARRAGRARSTASRVGPRRSRAVRAPSPRVSWRAGDRDLGSARLSRARPIPPARDAGLTGRARRDEAAGRRLRGSRRAISGRTGRRAGAPCRCTVGAEMQVLGAAMAPTQAARRRCEGGGPAGAASAGRTGALGRPFARVRSPPFCFRRPRRFCGFRGSPSRALIFVPWLESSFVRGARQRRGNRTPGSLPT